MTFRNTLAIAIAFATIAGAALFNGSPAEARGSKDVYIQDYQFAKPMHGYRGIPAITTVTISGFPTASASSPAAVRKAARSSAGLSARCASKEFTKRRSGNLP